MRRSPNPTTDRALMSSSANRPPTIDVSDVKPSQIRWGVLVALLIWLSMSSYYSVPTDSVGVILRLGRCQPDLAPPGLHGKLPFGIDQVTLVPTLRQQKLEFGFGSPGGTNPFQADTEAHLSQQVVTGDLNAALMQWVVQYRVDDPKLHLFRVREPQETLRDLIEAVMQEIVGDRTVDELLTIGRQEIEISARELLTKAVKTYELGVTIELVQLKDVDPPTSVQSSFDEVNKAQQDKESAVNMASGEYNKEVPRARGEAERVLSAAEGTALKRINEAEGDVASFTAQFSQYQKAPAVTRSRLYLEMLGEVLPQAGAKIIVDEQLKGLLPLYGTASTAQPLAPPTASFRSLDSSSTR
jgi:modulator of FtsH protease HflK